MRIFTNVLWGARCGESARRVLLGETGSRDYAHSVRRRRKSVLARKAPHGLRCSRLVSTILLDRWFAEEVRPRLRGKATFIRFADDGVFGFERQDDAERVMAVLSKRMERFGLTLHPQKTRLLDFRRPPRSRGEGKSLTSFDFLGFCWYWRRTRKGDWGVACKTRRARMVRAIQKVSAWCRKNRHLPVQQQHAKLMRRVQGHINYFGVNGNIVS